MKLNDLIETVDKESRKSLSEKQVITMLQTSAKKSYEIIKKTPIFKEDNGDSFILVTPQGKPTKTMFFVDKLIENFKTWSRFPSRSKCLRAFTSFSRAGEADSIYVVIPLDKTIIGITPSTTFYRSFSVAEKILDVKKLDNIAFTIWITHIASALSKLLDQKIQVDEELTWSQFKKLLDSLDTILKNDRNKIMIAIKRRESELTEIEKNLLANLLNRHITSVEQYLEEILNPDQNKFEVVKMESNNSLTKDAEVWIEGECILIKRSAYIELHKKGLVK